MPEQDIYSTFSDEINKIKQKDSYRFLKAMEGRDGKHITYRGKKYLNLSSNDYLALAADKGLHSDFYNGLNQENIIESYGLGSSSSRLLTGDYILYRELEKTISRLYNSQIESPAAEREALVFNSGYHANIGIISTLAGKGDLILSDRLNHASIIDGARLSKADVMTYTHRDYENLASILKTHRKKYTTVLIVSETVFSMDGDIADLKKLVELKDQYNALLYIDEAHAVGVFGKSGLGICEKENLIGDVDIIIATLGKAIASLGAYAVTRPVVKDYLINKMRTLIFTTSLPPVIINWNVFIMQKLESFQDRRKRLLNVTERLRKTLIEGGIETRGESHIVPIIIGDNGKTVAIAEELQEKGFLIFPIRPPTVPENSSRLRISLRADIEWDDVEAITGIIEKKLSLFS